MNRVFASIVATVLLQACASSQQDLSSEGQAYINVGGSALQTTAYRFNLQDGTQVWGVDCSGPGLNFSYCHQRAKYLCPKGYTVTDEKSSEGGSSGFIGPYGGGVNRSIDRSITVLCNQ